MQVMLSHDFFVKKKKRRKRVNNSLYQCMLTVGIYEMVELLVTFSLIYGFLYFSNFIFLQQT